MDSISIKNWPESDRPREKLIKYGSKALSNSELLAILIRTGLAYRSKSINALEIAKRILIKFKDLKSFSDISVSELARFRGIGPAKATQILAAIELGRRILSEKNGNNKSFHCSEEVANYYIPLLKDLKKEQFRVILFNVKNRVIKEVLISQGSLTTSIVHPREVIRSAIKNSAASVIFLHNHPSGDPEPSIEDLDITKRLIKSFDLVGIKVLDHIIVGSEGYFSFRQKNFL